MAAGAQKVFQRMMGCEEASTECHIILLLRKERDFGVKEEIHRVVDLFTHTVYIQSFNMMDDCLSY